VLYPGQFDELRQRDLSKHVAVVFDVLRATSAELPALANGALSIRPVLEVEEAFKIKRKDPSVLLGGERNSFKPEGFELGNSPLEYTSERVRGRKIVHTTTNGTLALDSCVKAESIYLGTLLGLSALARELLQLKPEHLLLICAGTHSHFALEDGIAAGALVARLLDAATLTASARACLAIWRCAEKDPSATLAVTRNALRLKSVGLEKDVEYCSRVDTIDRVAKVRGGEVKLV
jgi:2-phosphosulfolactate phosphatase